MQLCNLTLRAAVFIGCFALLPHTLYAQDVCEAFAKYGIYDTQTTTSDTDKAASFRSWFCQSTFESKQAADSAGFSLGYGGFSLGFESNGESWSQFSSNYCRDDSYSSKYRQATLSFVQTINANASNNMLACFLRGGLHARIIQGAGQDTFYIQARMTPTGSTTKANVVDFAIIGGTCSGPMKNGYEITAAGVEQICRRSGDQAVDISLSASEQVNWDTPRGLKRIPPAPTAGEVPQDGSINLPPSSCADPKNTDHEGYNNKDCTWLNTYLNPIGASSEFQISLKLTVGMTSIGCNDPHRRAEVFLKYGDITESRSGMLGMNNVNNTTQEYSLPGVFKTSGKKSVPVVVFVNPRGCTKVTLNSGELKFKEVRQ